MVSVCIFFVLEFKIICCAREMSQFSPSRMEYWSCYCEIHLHIKMKYFKLSIYCGYIWYRCVHSTTVTMVKLQSDLHSRTTPYTSPLRASYGVSFASYTKKDGHDISRVHCMLIRLNGKMYHILISSRDFVFKWSYFSVYWQAHRQRCRTHLKNIGQFQNHISCHWVFARSLGNTSYRLTHWPLGDLKEILDK